MFSISGIPLESISVTYLEVVTINLNKTFFRISYSMHIQKHFISKFYYRFV